VSLTLADAAEARDFLGLRVSVDGTTGLLMPPAAQFHVHNFRMGKDEVYFLSQIAGLTLPEADYGRPGTNGEKGTWRCKIFAPSREAHDAMVDALQRAGIDFRPGTPLLLAAVMVATMLSAVTIPLAGHIRKPLLFYPTAIDFGLSRSARGR
jgi:hypothetical protein